LHPLIPAYAALVVAIGLEVAGTSLLPFTKQFSRLVPTLIAAACYAASLYGLTLALKALPVSVVYAMWSGLGIVLIGLVDRFYFKQHLDGWAMLGFAMILGGVLVLNVLSKSIHH